jgi:hypothetical protein
MKPPPGAKIYEGELATFWLDENGILCAVSKDTVRTLEKQKENYAFIRQIIGDKKVCLLSDTTTSSPQDKETRDYSALELPKIFKAMAVISDSASGRFTANVYKEIKKEPVPIQIFNSEEEAKEWLKQFL